MQQRNRPPSAQTWMVIGALAAEPLAWRYGYDLCQETGLKAGSMYPILIRLTGMGWLETAWEEELPAGRPPRHLYRLTAAGQALASEFAAESTEASGANRKLLQPQTGDAR